MNIHGLPVLRDDLGAFGSPTSDSVRTMVTEQAEWFLVVFFDFGNSEKLESAVNELAEFLAKFAGGKEEFRWVV